MRTSGHRQEKLSPCGLSITQRLRELVGHSSVPYILNKQGADDTKDREMRTLSWPLPAHSWGRGEQGALEVQRVRGVPPKTPQPVADDTAVSQQLPRRRADRRQRAKAES